jgi:mycothiol synthase
VTGVTDVRIDTLDHLAPADVVAVLDLVAAAVDADGRRPLSEHTELHLEQGGEHPARHLLARRADGAVVGYAHVDPSDDVEGTAAELVVHPAVRRRGLGRSLVRAAEATSPDGRLRLWSHGDHPAAALLSRSLGYERIRSLWLMRRDLSRPLPAAEVPAGVVLRAFRPGADDVEWLRVNKRAFEGHPEQGLWTERDLHARMHEPWFDPQGFLVAADAATGAMLGFHWTKVHGGSAGHGHGHGAIGEVYVVGVDPAAQGRRLGRALTLAGLHHLQDEGLRAVMLYVESDNARALSVYTGLGFVHADTDVMYRRLAVPPLRPAGRRL